MRLPAIVHHETLKKGATTEIDGKWVAARPEPYYQWSYRFKAAWLVFTGKCDALKWPGNQ